MLEFIVPERGFHFLHQFERFVIVAIAALHLLVYARSQRFQSGIDFRIKLAVLHGLPLRGGRCIVVAAQDIHCLAHLFGARFIDAAGGLEQGPDFVENGLAIAEIGCFGFFAHWGFDRHPLRVGRGLFTSI